MKEKIKIVTHSSHFHTDDIFAVATLLLALEKDYEITVIRSRDQDIINSADYVVDVGGIYDESKNRFDHHQEGKAGVRDNGIFYASFGLVWKKFGEQICRDAKIAKKVDELLVQPIDGPDNGIQIFETKIKDVYPMDLGFLTNIFSATWKEDLSKIDENFIELVSFAKIIISRVIIYSTDMVEGEVLVLNDYNNSEDKRLVLTNNGYPWLEVLSKFPEPLFVIYENPRDQTWSIKGIRNNFFTFKYRKFLPESWAGKNFTDLDKITGVSGCVFCHNHRFMAVNKTKEGILKMAEIALNS